MSFNLEGGKNSEVNETPDVEVDSEQLSETEETAENFDDCSLDKVRDSNGNEVNAESLEDAEENYEDCQAKMEDMEEENPELAEDDFSDCGKEAEGRYVAEVTYTTDGEVSDAEAGAELQEAYNECDDPEDMQQLMENANESGHIEVKSAEVIERPEPTETDSETTEEEYEETQKELEEAEENLESQQEAAEEYQEELENEINKHEEVPEGAENINNEISEENENSENEEISEDVEEPQNTEVEENNENQVEDDSEQDLEADDAQEESKETDESDPESTSDEKQNEEINEGSELSEDEESEVTDDVSANETEEIPTETEETSAEAEEAPAETEKVESENLEQMDEDSEVDVSNIDTKDITESVSQKVEEETRAELGDETKEQIQEDVSSEIEEKAEDDTISAQEAQEIADKNVAENTENVEEQNEVINEEIENKAAEVTENENLTREEAEQQVEEEVSDSVDEKLSKDDVNEMVEEKTEDIEAAVEDEKEEQENLEAVEQAAEEMEEEQQEEAAEQTEKSLQEKIEDAFEKEDVSIDEIHALVEENAENLKQTELERAEIEVKASEMFEEVLTKEHGTEDYKQALKNYNELQNQKEIINSRVVELKKQQGMLEEKEAALHSRLSEQLDDKQIAMGELSCYMSEHGYGPSDFDKYSQDVEWRMLQRRAFPDYDLPPISQENAYSQLGDYMREHNYGPDDFDEYSQDPEWRELQTYAFPDYELPPLKEGVPKFVEETGLSSEEQALKVEEYKKSLKEYCEANGIAEIADFTDFDPRVAYDLVKSIDDAKKDFPELEVKFLGSIDKQVAGVHETIVQNNYQYYIQNGLDEDFARQLAQDDADYYVEINKLDKTEGTYAWSLRCGVPALEKYDGVAINNQYAGDYELFKEKKQYDEKEKWAPVGCGSPKAVSDHELGHEIDKLLDASYDIEIQKMYSHMMKGNPEEQLSGYSAKNIQEFIAEAYSEYKNNPNPRPTSVAVYNRLLELRDMKNKKGADIE